MGVGHSNYIILREVENEKLVEEVKKSDPKETKAQKEIRLHKLKHTLKMLKIEREQLDKNTENIIKMKRELQKKKKTSPKKKKKSESESESESESSPKKKEEKKKRKTSPKKKSK